MCEVKALSIATLKQRGLKSFLVVDIRSSLAYKSAHLADSLHLDSPQAILDFYKTSRANHASHCFHNLSLTQDSLTPPPLITISHYLLYALAPKRLRPSPIN